MQAHITETYQQPAILTVNQLYRPNKNQASCSKQSTDKVKTEVWPLKILTKLLWVVKEIKSKLPHWGVFLIKLWTEQRRQRWQRLIMCQRVISARIQSPRTLRLEDWQVQRRIDIFTKVVRLLICLNHRFLLWVNPSLKNLITLKKVMVHPKQRMIAQT